MATFIEGYLATITLDAIAYHPYSSDATLGLTRDAIDKTKLGEDRRTYLSGLGDGSIDATLHLATEFAVAIQTAYDKTTPLAYVFRPGALGTKDFSQAGAADGEWDVALSLQLTGQYTYTAPV
jgi:hypothetical protein